MGPFRTFLLGHRRLAVLLVALALALKALVPAGYMLAPQTTVLSVTICADGQGKRIAHDIAVPKKAGHGDEAGDHAKDAACSWSSLAAGALGGAAPELLAALLVFILALGFRSAAPPSARSASRLRPPLRAPPVLA